MANIFSGEYWNRLLERAGSEWPNLTEEDLRRAGAGRDALSARLAERYEMTHEEASQKVGEWVVRAQQRV